MLKVEEGLDRMQDSVSIQRHPVRHEWHYEALEIPLAQTSMLIARVMIGRVVDGARLSATLAAVLLIQDDLASACCIWVRDAIAALEVDEKSLGTRMANWERIEQTSNTYMAQKRE